MTIPKVRLGEIVEVKGGGTPSKSNPGFWSGDIPWVSPKDMKSWEIKDAVDKITQSAIKSSATNLIPTNSILLVNRSGILKHTLPVGITRRPVAINQDIKALVCGSRAHPEYIAHLVKSAEPVVLKWVRATTADNFPIDNLRELEIPLPPLDEQKRIAAILDKADQLRQKRRQAIALLDGLRQSIFLEMFGDPVSNPKGLPAKPLGSIVSKVGSGATPKGGDASYKPFGIPLIRSMNVRDGAFKTDGLAFIDDNQAKKLNNVIVENGDVLLNITGASIARVCRAPELKVAARVNQHVAIIRPNAALDSYYLEAILLAPSFKRKLLSIGESGATRQAITKSQIEDLIVPAPAIETQMEFRNKIENIECQIRFSKKHSSSLDMAFSSLQHRAFSGQL